MGERLHPAAIAVYAVDALRQGAFPLLVILAVSVFGGDFDAQAALRAAGFALLGTAVAALAGAFRWATTRYSFDGGETVRLRTGALSVKEVEIPFARVQAVDVEQGPIQRLFGVYKVEVQTGGGGQGGEVVLGAVEDREIAHLNELLRRGAPDAIAEPDAAPAPERRLSGRRLALAAATSGQLGVLVPVAAGVAQMGQQLFDDPIEGERTIAGALPDGALAWILLAAGVLVLAWLLAALGTVIGFGGFAVRRERDELRIRRGLLQRRQATLRVGARAGGARHREPPAPGARAGRAARRGDRPRQGAGGRADAVPAAAPRGGRAVPARAAAGDGRLARRARRPAAARAAPLRPAAARRRPRCSRAAAAIAASSPWPLLAAPLGALYGALGYRAAGWRLEGGRLAVRSRRLARSTVLAPAAGRESHDLEQTVLQRRARLADVAVAFGKGTIARIRHLDADDARGLWAAIGPR